MQYIIGTKITAPRSKSTGHIRPGMSSAQIRELSRRSTTGNKQLEKLKPGETYTLARIYTEDQHVMYKFASTTDVCVLEFNNVNEAENFISEIRGESLKDYTDVYKNMTD